MDALIELEPSPAASAVGSTTADQFVTFTVGKRAFGIDIMSVREIRSWAPVTALPSQPFGAIGVLDIRGSIVQVYDLQRMLGTGEIGDDGQVVLVVSLSSHDVGLLVSSVSDIIFAQPDDLRMLPDRADDLDAQVSFLVKNQERLIAILNLGALFPGEVGGRS